MKLTNSWYEKGRAEGIKEVELKIAKRMLEGNYDIEQISKMIGLSLEEIKKIMN